jgi:hypothetical protein
MSHQSEDNLLDQSLRDVFRDYDLPPDAHPRVWEGVAERIATLPAPSTGSSYRLLLLPLAAAVGIGLGWLLPHPAAQQAPAEAVPAMQVASYAPATAAAPAAALLPNVNTATVDVQPTYRAMAQPRQVRQKQRVALHPQPEKVAQADALVVLDSMSTAAVQATVTPEVTVPADSAPVAMPAPMPTPATTPMASVQAKQLPSKEAAKTTKPAGTNEKIGYRKLSQRQPEGRRGVGRWFTRLFQGVRHLLS